MSGMSGMNDKGGRVSDNLTKAKQWGAAVLLMLGGIAGAYGIRAALSHKTEVVVEKPHFDPIPKGLESSATLERTQDAAQKSLKMVKELKQKVKTLQATLDATSQQDKAATKNPPLTKAQIDQMVEQRVEAKLSKFSAQFNFQDTSASQPTPLAQTRDGSYAGKLFSRGHSNPTPTAMHGGMREDHLALKQAHPKRPDKNPDNYVPAGTFVRAVMLGGADASAAVDANRDPETRCANVKPSRRSHKQLAQPVPEDQIHDKIINVHRAPHNLPMQSAKIKPPHLQVLLSVCCPPQPSD